jgi:hydrogenase small subunit
MLSLSADPWTSDQTLQEHLETRGVSRRQFLRFARDIGVMLGVAQMGLPKLAKALSVVKRPSVVWLQLQECTGCVESVLRTNEPTIGNLLLDVVSLDYNHTLMAASGHAAEEALQTAMKDNAGEYLLVVSGSIPTKDNGIYTMIGGRSAETVIREAAKGAAAIVALGACAHFGGVQSARPNPTDAKGVRDIIRDRPILTIAGCPPIGDVLTASVVHWLTFKRLPESDSEGRPLFAYGKRIHDQCPRRAHFDAGQYVEQFDDEGAKKGWCLYKVGCKGPATSSPCPIFLWNDQTSWPIGSGHPCLGCTEANFWDTMSPFYTRLPEAQVAGFGIEKNVDRIGAALALTATAGVGIHALVTGVQMSRRRADGSTYLLDAPPEERANGSASGHDDDYPTSH